MDYVMSTVDEIIDNLVTTIFDILNKQPSAMTKSEENIKNYIEKEKTRCREFISSIMNRTLYESDRNGLIDSVLDIIITRVSINKLVLKLISNHHLFYNIDELDKYLRFVAKSNGFELDYLISSSPLFAYFVENIKQWYATKGTEESLTALIKLIYPFTNVEFVKIHVFKQTYNVENGNSEKYTVIEFADRNAKLDYDPTYQYVYHYTEYSDDFYNDPSFTKSSLPIIAFAQKEVGESDSIKELRKIIMLILDDPLYSEMYINYDKLTLSIHECIILFLVSLRLIYPDIPSSIIQEKWYEYYRGVIDDSVLLSIIRRRLLDSLSAQYNNHSSLIDLIARYYLEKAKDAEVTKRIPDTLQLTTDIINLASSNSNISRPSTFSRDINDLATSGKLVAILYYTMLKRFLSTRIDISKKVLIHNIVENLSDTVVHLIYTFKDLIEKGLLNKKSIIYIMLDIMSLVEGELGIKNLFTSYLSTLDTRTDTQHKLYSIISAFKPVFLHLGDAFIICDNITPEHILLFDTNMITTYEDFNDSIPQTTDIDYCTLLQTITNKQNVDQLTKYTDRFDPSKSKPYIFNLFGESTNVDILEISSNKLKLDSSKESARQLSLDTMFEKSIDFYTKNSSNTIKHYITNYNQAIRDLCIISSKQRDGSNKNIEVVTW
jgi:hypothetical protein